MMKKHLASFRDGFEREHHM